MPTRGNPLLVARSIRAFQLQTWPNRELIIVSERRSSKLEALVDADPRIHLHDAPAGLTLGDKRNLCVARAAGSFVATWDDDDCHAPQRLSVSLQVLMETGADVVYLNRLMIWIPQRRRLGLSSHGLWENTMVARRSMLPAYPAMERGSDTAVKQMLAGHAAMAVIDHPFLYCYCHTGENTWEESHFLAFLEAGAQEFRGQAYAEALGNDCFRCLHPDGAF